MNTRSACPWTNVWWPILLAGLVVSPTGHAADNPFAAGVRATDPLSPSEQQRLFELPPGFEIELVAAEPDIAKPMNLAFDPQGRLWVSDSYEYPFAAPLDRPGKDAIKVLEDTDGDGRYDQTTTFVDGLNIPIGLYPYKQGVIAWSIPHIWYFEDTDGDQQADRRTQLYGPLGYERDTHGMNSSFTRGFDGWLYVTHGFNNNTTIRGTDGSEIFMNSGNTYRIRLDGSRVEQYTYGQVNPFGMALDPLGNLYTSDCHSMPAYLLIRDAYYPSFGKPHDGLGFAPKIMEHSHGSTAIDGVVYYSDDQWPLQYRDNVFIGNVMTSRVNRDILLEHGSGKRAREEDDFIKTSDPWFRPVNMQFGPDGSLYIADFYNRIIGHYEVPLQHPGRDRHRGRIWKVSFRGTPGQPPQRSHPFDLTKLSVSGLFNELASANLIRRQLAMNYLLDEHGAAAADPAQALFENNQSENWQQRTHALWILHRLARLTPTTLRQAANDPAREVRVHAMRVLSETRPWTAEHARLAIEGLNDSDLVVQRMAADAIGQHPHISTVRPLLDALERSTDSRPFLRHTLRIALRNQLRDEAVFTAVRRQTWPKPAATNLASVCAAIASPNAAGYLLDHLEEHSASPRQMSEFATQIAKHATAEDLDRLPGLAKAAFPQQLERQLAIHEAARAGSATREGNTFTAIEQWGTELAGQLLDRIDDTPQSWTHAPVPGMAPTTIPWIVETRRSADGNSSAPFICSLSPGGESFTGTLRSSPFEIPPKLGFFIAGHDGYPDKKAQGRNHVRLRLSGNHEIVATAPAPRNDTATPVSWDLSQYTGQSGYLEITDADDAGAYAWLAVGRFDPAVVALPAASPQHHSRLLIRTAALAATLSTSQIREQLIATLTNPSVAASTRAAMAVELSRSNKHPLAGAVARQLQSSSLTAEQRQAIVQDLFSPEFSDKASEVIRNLFTLLTAREQRGLTLELTTNVYGGELLLDLVAEGIAPVQLLNLDVVKRRFQAHGGAPEARRAELTADLPENEVNRTQRVQQLARAYNGRQGNPANGRLLFQQACQLCHQLGGEGTLVGPQLDGIGNRGVERILEDMLDPNRNVDKAFHTTTLSLKNGDVITGLYRRDEGSLVFLVNAAGQEFSVSNAEITQRRISQRSLMPDNFGELFETQQITDLVSFLLSTGE